MNNNFKKIASITLVLSFIILLSGGCSGGKKQTSHQEGTKDNSISSNASNSETNLSDPSSESTQNQTGNVDDTMTNNTNSKSDKTKAPATTTKPTTGTTTSNGGNNQKPKFTPLGKDIMPIGAWVAPPQANVFYPGSPDFIKDEYYKAVADSGINIIYGLYERMAVNPNDVMRALDSAGRNNLKYLVSDSGVYMAIDDDEGFLEKVNEYKNKPAYLGNMVCDEPAIPEFAHLASIQAAFKKFFPNRYAYVNMMPSIAQKDQLLVNKQNETGGQASAEVYKKYLDDYINIVKPQLLSYDDYPLVGTFPNIRDNYFGNMSIIRHTADAAGIPSWMFVQTCKYNSSTRIPKESEIKWLVNTALAYGFQGIQYFTFWLPVETSFEGAMMTRDGKKTEVYNYVQKMNKHIVQIDDVLMNTTFKGLMVNGKSPDTIPSNDIISKYGVLESVKGKPATMTGCFSYGSQTAYYVVNNSLTESGDVTLTFNKKVNLRAVKQGVSTNASGNTYTLNLSPGEGVLVVV